MKLTFRAVVLAVMIPLAGCSLLGGPTKVGHAELYQSGDSRYDSFFQEVYQEQHAAQKWPEDKKAARRPLTTNLAIDPGASDSALIAATHERAKKLGVARLDLTAPRVIPGPGSDPGLFSSIEDTTRAEIDRARRLHQASDRLEDIAKRGDVLREYARRDDENRAADKADEKKVEQSHEIRRELAAGVEAMRDLAREGRLGAKGAEQFLTDLAEALDGGTHEGAAKKAIESSPPPPPPPAPSASASAKPSPAKPAPAKPKPPTPAAPPAPTDKPVPSPPPDKPATSPPAEVFTP